MVVNGRAFVVEGEQGDESHPGADEAADAFVELFLVAAFEQVADEDEDGFVGSRDEPLAVAYCTVDVGAASELGAEEGFDGIAELVGDVDDGGVEEHERGAYRFQRCHHRGEDAGIDDGSCHRTALVNTEDDVAEGGGLASEADPLFGNDGLVLRLVVLEVSLYGAGPIDLVVPGAARADGTV